MNKGRSKPFGGQGKDRALFDRVYDIGGRDFQNRIVEAEIAMIYRRFSSRSSEKSAFGILSEQWRNSGKKRNGIPLFSIGSRN